MVVRTIISWEEAALLLVESLRAKGRLPNVKVEVNFTSSPGDGGLEYVEFKEINENPARGVKAGT